MKLFIATTVTLLTMYSSLFASTLEVGTYWTSDYLLNPYNQDKFQLLGEKISMVQLQVNVDNTVFLSLDPNYYGIDENGETIAGGAVGGTYNTYRAELDSDDEDQATYKLIPHEDNMKTKDKTKLRLVHLKKVDVLRLVFIQPYEKSEDYQTPVIVTLYQY